MALTKGDGSYDMRSKGAKAAKSKETGQGCLVLFIYIPLAFASLAHIAFFLEAYSSGISSYFSLFTSESSGIYWITLIGLIINLFLVYKFFHYALTAFVFAGTIWFGFGYFVTFWKGL
jgi:hypothetical protein|tara:strand:- start:65 stop:418 length:354 start_codon:yes stop_codon:yes gene_type:complete